MVRQPGMHAAGRSLRVSRCGASMSTSRRIRPVRAALIGGMAVILIGLGWHLVRGERAEAAPHGRGGDDTVVVESAVATHADVPVYLEGLGLGHAFCTANDSPA